MLVSFRSFSSTQSVSTTKVVQHQLTANNRYNLFKPTASLHLSYMSNLEQLSEADFLESLADYKKYVKQLVNASEVVTSMVVQVAEPEEETETAEALPLHFEIVTVTNRVGRKRKKTSMFAHKRVDSSQAVPPSAQLPAIDEIEEAPPKPKKRGRKSNAQKEEEAALLATQHAQTQA